MDREGFRQSLHERQVPVEQLDAQVALAERFEAFAASPPTAGDVRAFSAILVEEGVGHFELARIRA